MICSTDDECFCVGILRTSYAYALCTVGSIVLLFSQGILLCFSGNDKSYFGAPQGDKRVKSSRRTSRRRFASESARPQERTWWVGEHGCAVGTSFPLLLILFSSWNVDSFHVSWNLGLWESREMGREFRNERVIDREHAAVYNLKHCEYQQRFVLICAFDILLFQVCAQVEVFNLLSECLRFAKNTTRDFHATFESRPRTFWFHWIDPHRCWYLLRMCYRRRKRRIMLSDPFGNGDLILLETFC